MKLSFLLKMSKPIDSKKHFVSPGGFEVIAGGKDYQFDFCESRGYHREDDPSLIAFELVYEDRASFPGVKRLKQHLHEITEFSEFFVCTEGQNGAEPDLYPESVSELYIEDGGDGYREVPDSSEFVEVTDLLGEEVSKKGNCYLFGYKFSDKLPVKLAH